MSTVVVACAGKERYGNREKFEVMFQFQERQKKEFGEKKGTKGKKRDLEERRNGAKH
jgi:hypothetical protein